MKEINEIIMEHDHKNFGEFFSTMIQFSASPESGIEIYTHDKKITRVPEKEIRKIYKKDYRKANSEKKQIIQQLEHNTWTTDKKEKTSFLKKLFKSFID